ncbi:MAG: hypothetical protein GTO61_02425 [Gemmatimonadales bacterium]|nr:hypothetical protein [Gemmatimonadales bacterium]
MVASGVPKWFLHSRTKEADGSRSRGRQQEIIDAAIAHGWSAIYMIVDAHSDTPGSRP